MREGRAEDPRANARRRVLILNLFPDVDCGRFSAKAIAGDAFRVEADLIADGHELVTGVVRYRHESDEDWREAPLSPAGIDRYGADICLDREGPWLYEVEGWMDSFATWRRAMRARIQARQDVHVDLLIGARMVAEAAERARGDDREALRELARAMADGPSRHERVTAAMHEHLAELMTRHPDRSQATRSPAREAFADRPRARFSAWYEMFPRSCGPGQRHGTFRDAEKLLGYVASMGFDIVYLPPIHPIGTQHRKGRNNTLQCKPDDPGSPWAIGAREGGHTAVHPQLGTLADFRRFVSAARDKGLEVALDVAFQASPDHPWVRRRPQWFVKRPDGTIQYAENPPKKYQDIYPLNFDCDDWTALWNELLGVFLHWLDEGVRVFRVDNPHTKSLRFWEWCIAELKKRDPGVILLAEAFTRPSLMYALAKLGFTQSYTYFTWRNTKHDFIEYMRELVRPDVAAFFRPNFWPNTPDILPEHLQHGGRAAFMGRLVLAATLSASYGIYGPAYELMEHVARPGAEEYIDNEKYEIKEWDLESRWSLSHFIGRVNRIRRDHPALHHTTSLCFHHADNDAILVYSKRHGHGSADDVILVAVNLDWQRTQGSRVWLDLGALGVPADQPFEVHDLLTGARYRWHGPEAYVELDPAAVPAHILHVVRPERQGAP